MVGGSGIDRRLNRPCRGIPKCLWVSESEGTDSVLGARSMPKPYSEDLRERVIEAVESGASRREAAENFRLSPSSAVRWWRRWRDTGSAKGKRSGGSKSPSVGAGAVGGGQEL
jgi:hypothetical protein